MNLQPAIIGLGQVAWRFDEEAGRVSAWSHAGAYRAAGYAAPIGYDLCQGARDAFARRYPDATVMATVEEVVEARPDVISICTPSALHAETMDMVLAAGPSAIWCEKPLSIDVDDARRMVDACAGSDVSLTVSYVRRWAPLWVEFKSRVEADEIGELRCLRVAMPNRIWSIGSHALDLLLWLGGDVEDMQSTEISALSEEGEPAFNALLQFVSGVSGILQTTGRRANLIVEAEAIGDAGRLVASEADMEIRHEVFEASRKYDGYRELGPANNKRVAVPDNFSPFTAIAREIKGFADGAAGAPTCSGADALRTQEILAQIAGKPISGEMIS